MRAARDVSGTVIAFDYGARRIGIAVGETAAASASALTCLVSSREGVPDWDGIDAIVADWRPVMLVVGSPRNEDGSGSAMEKTTAAFAATLGARFALPVVEVDEYLSSAEASARLRDGRRSGSRKRRVGKGDVDALAAQVILETWMSGRGNAL